MDIVSVPPTPPKKNKGKMPDGLIFAEYFLVYLSKSESLGLNAAGLKMTLQQPEKSFYGSTEKKTQGQAI